MTPKAPAVSQLAGKPKKKFLRMQVVDGRVSMEAVEDLIGHIKKFKGRAEQAEKLLRSGILAMNGRARVAWADEVRKFLTDMD